MQADLVIIPTYDRPEMLWLCLDHLAASPEHSSVRIRVYVDAHVGQPLPPKAEIQEVLDKFPQLSIQVGYRPPHIYPGNSYNVMMAYKDAFEMPTLRHVFLIEDDILIRPEFFSWHRYQHAEPLGCSIGVVREPQHAAYASLGVCFRREMVQLILPHCRPAYFQAQRAYCRQMFPPTKIDCEQDGLWTRVLAGYPIVWATTPLAQHVGWYGYHRKRSLRPQGSLAQRYVQVKQVLSNATMLHEWAKEFGDVQPLRHPCT